MQAEGLCKEGTQGDGSAAAWQIDRADGKEKRVGSTRKSLWNQKKKRQRTLAICKEDMYNQTGFRFLDCWKVETEKRKYAFFGGAVLPEF